MPDETPAKPTVPDTDSHENPEEKIPRAVMTDRLSRQRHHYEGQLTVVSGQVATLRDQIAAVTTERDKYRTEHITADSAHKKAIADMEGLKSDYALSGALTEIGGAMDPEVKETITARYRALDAKDRPAFKTWLGTDVVARALLGAKAPVPPPKIPDGNNGTKADADPLMPHNISAESIRKMSLEDLKKHRADIAAGKFSVDT